MQYLIAPAASELFRQTIRKTQGYAMYRCLAKKYNMTSAETHAVIFIDASSNNCSVVCVAEDAAAAANNAADKVAHYAQASSTVSITGPEAKTVASIIEDIRKFDHSRENDLFFSFPETDATITTISFNE